MRWLARLAVAAVALVAACGAPQEQYGSERLAEEVRVPQLQGRVNDYANILSPEQEAALTRRLEAIETRTPKHDQVVILTVPSLGGVDMELYANEVGRQWNIGQREHNNGMLIVVSLDPRRIRFETAGGVQDRMTDARAILIQRRQMLPHLATGEENYFAALDEATKATEAVLMGESSGDASVDSGTDPSIRVARERATIPDIPDAVLAALIIGGLITFLAGFAAWWMSPVLGAATGAVAGGLGSAFALASLATIGISAGIGLVLGLLIGLLATGMRAGVIDPFFIIHLLLSGGGGGGSGGFSGGGGGDWSGGGASSDF